MLIPITPVADRRILHVGDKGDDVKAYGRLVARALKVLGLVPVNAQNGIYGEGLLLDTIRLQRASKIKPTGRVGTLTWQAVDPQMRAYERYLLRKKPPPPAPIGQRIAHEMTVMLVFGLTRYTQFRPAATTLALWRRLGGDCSGSALLARALALGALFSGTGNTQYIWDHFPVVLEHDVQIGDALLYGNSRTGKTEHVAVVDNVKNQTAIGFGSAPGRRAGWRSYRQDVMGFRRMQ